MMAVVQFVSIESTVMMDLTAVLLPVFKQVNLLESTMHVNLLLLICLYLALEIDSDSELLYSQTLQSLESQAIFQHRSFLLIDQINQVLLQQETF